MKHRRKPIRSELPTKPAALPSPGTLALIRSLADRGELYIVLRHGRPLPVLTPAGRQRVSPPWH